MTTKERQQRNPRPRSERTNASLSVSSQRMAAFRIHIDPAACQRNEIWRDPGDQIIHLHLTLCDVSVRKAPDILNRPHPRYRREGCCWCRRNPATRPLRRHRRDCCPENMQGADLHPDRLPAQDCAFPRTTEVVIASNRLKTPGDSETSDLWACTFAKTSSVVRASPRRGTRKSSL